MLLRLSSSPQGEYSCCVPSLGGHVYIIEFPELLSLEIYNQDRNEATAYHHANRNWSTMTMGIISLSAVAAGPSRTTWCSMILMESTHTPLRQRRKRTVSPAPPNPSLSRSQLTLLCRRCTTTSERTRICESAFSHILTSLP